MMVWRQWRPISQLKRRNYTAAATMFILSIAFLSSALQSHFLIKYSTLSSDGSSIINNILLEHINWTSLDIIFDYVKYYIPPNQTDLDVPLDADKEGERCKRYGYEYKGRKTRRRIYYGGLIADDSWHAVLTHAIEAHGLYHTVSFVESNATTSHQEIGFETTRKLRFTPGSSELKLMTSGIFGKSAKVTVDLYTDHPDERKDHNPYNAVEELQRYLILERWRQNGMTEDDVGIVSDTDEMFTRDFLLAAQTCDIPQFRPNQDCHAPKIIGRSLVFESTPECATAIRTWHHPDMISGQCVDTIGNSHIHKPAKRYWNGKGPRLPGYGYKNDYTMLPKNTTMFPLLTTQEIRNMAGGTQQGKVFSSFHYHNSFDSVKLLRNKYLTYSHTDKKALRKLLGQLHEDVLLGNNCVTDIPDSPNAHYKRIVGGFDSIDGQTPILFQLAEYRAARQKEWREQVLEDEGKFGRYNGTNGVK